MKPQGLPHMCWPINVKKAKLYCIAHFICDHNASFDDICVLKCTKLSCNYFLKLITKKMKILWFSYS
jgi:hypothetical protein